MMAAAQSPFRAQVNAICGSFPGAEWSDPWGGGHDAWKVCDKMFACIGSVEDGVSVKTPDIETASMLIDSGVAQRAPYFHKSWVRMPTNTEADELNHRLSASYDLIRSKLPAKLRNALPPREET